MVGGRAGYEYSTKRGATHHTIEPGYVYRMAWQPTEHNPKTKTRIPHVLYIWVQRIQKPKKHQRPNRVKIRVARCLIPAQLDDGEDYYIVRQATMDVEYLVKLLDRGYRIITSRCKFNGTKWCWGNFYKACGLMD